jgi:hypothetical protein
LDQLIFRKKKPTNNFDKFTQTDLPPIEKSLDGSRDKRMRYERDNMERSNRDRRDGSRERSKSSVKERNDDRSRHSRDDRRCDRDDKSRKYEDRNRRSEQSKNPRKRSHSRSTEKRKDSPKSSDCDKRRKYEREEDSSSSRNRHRDSRKEPDLRQTILKKQSSESTSKREKSSEDSKKHDKSLPKKSDEILSVKSSDSEVEIVTVAAADKIELKIDSNVDDVLLIEINEAEQEEIISETFKPKTSVAKPSNLEKENEKIETAKVPLKEEENDFEDGEIVEDSCDAELKVKETSAQELKEIVSHVSPKEEKKNVLEVVKEMKSSPKIDSSQSSKLKVNEIPKQDEKIQENSILPSKQNDNEKNSRPAADDLPTNVITITKSQGNSTKLNKSKSPLKKHAKEDAKPEVKAKSPIKESKSKDETKISSTKKIKVSVVNSNQEIKIAAKSLTKVSMQSLMKSELKAPEEPAVNDHAQLETSNIVVPASPPKPAQEIEETASVSPLNVSVLSPSTSLDSPNNSKENSLNQSQENSNHFKVKRRSFTKDVADDGTVILTVCRKKKKKQKS